MTDLTKITTPFGLLDDETRAALRAHGGPYEYAGGGTSWAFREVTGHLAWFPSNVYRVKPTPPAPREYWITSFDNMAWDTEEDAQAHNSGFDKLAGEIVYAREVPK
jgi:hypothetical protein